MSFDDEKSAKKRLKYQIKREKKEIKKSLKDEKRLNKKINKEVNNEIKLEKYEENAPKRAEILRKNEAPYLSVLEEVGNSVTHGVGAILAIIGIILLFMNSDTDMKIVSSIFYGFSMFIMMLMSCLYHAFKWGSKVKRIWRRFDYSCIYLLIGGTFAPFQLVYLDNIYGIIWFIIMWVAIITGITIICVFGPGRVKWLHYTLYFLLGWTGLIFVPIWILDNRFDLLLWILAGGIVYTLGMIPFAKRGVKAAHFIWHFFVLAGAITHFIGVYICLYGG